MSTGAKLSAEAERRHDASGEWQRSLRSFMAAMIALCGVAFVGLSGWQLLTLQERVDRASQAVSVRAVEDFAVGDERFREQHFAMVQWKSLVEMEAATVTRRYQQASASLLTRLSATYMGFLTGVILALVGAGFVLGKMREDMTNLQANSGKASLILGTSSPGLVLVVLGTVLILAAQLTHHQISVVDEVVYLSADPERVGREPSRAAEGAHTALQQEEARDAAALRVLAAEGGGGTRGTDE